MSPPLDDATRKRIATAQALSALLGATLTLYENDFGRPELTLNRWCFTKAFTLAQLDDLEELLQRMGAPA